MDKDTIQLGILNLLLERLNGKCSNSIRCCPMHIASEIKAPQSWHCRDCISTFGYLGITAESNFPCPCVIAPGYAVLALEEEIERRR